MPALNFQKQFAPAVESFTKRQTIRRNRRDGRDPQKGCRLFLYTGMRTKSCRKLGETVCKSSEPIWIFYQDIRVDGRLLDHEEALALAKADGFDSLGDFYLFFLGEDGCEFNGYLIKW